MAKRLLIICSGVVAMIVALAGGYWLGTAGMIGTPANAADTSGVASGTELSQSQDPQVAPSAAESAAPSDPPAPSGPPAATEPAQPALPPNAKVVYLTFDDGPDPTWTDQVLGLLKQYDARGTFFMQGVMVENYPDVARRVVAAGNRVENHSYNHPYLTNLSYSSIVDGQLLRTNTVIKNVTGLTPTCVRPPYGATSSGVRGAIGDTGMTQQLWDVDPKDWSNPGADRIVDRVMSNVAPGAVVLMHDSGSDRSQTVSALAQILPALKAQGYSFGFACDSAPAKPLP